jgi:predicted O-methyltransferase YrrM
MRRWLHRFMFRHRVKVHRLGLRAGLRIAPNHYYSPLINLDELRATRDRWAKRRDMTGLRIDLDAQAAQLRDWCLPFRDEYRDNAAYIRATYEQYGPGYGPIEAQALHGVLRALKPRRIIEIGSGVSTACMLDALMRNEAEGVPAELICIEPHPSDAIRTLQKDGRITLLDQPVQDVEGSQFRTLQAGDVLFVDGTHVVQTGGDVNRIVLEILPRLASGVVVHVHDVYLPFDYPPDALRSIFHWPETALLQAWMTDNARVEIACCMSLLHHDAPGILREVFPGYDPMPMTDGLQPDGTEDFSPTSRHFPSSMWLRMQTGRLSIST